MEGSFRTGDIIKARVIKVPFLFHTGIIVTNDGVVSIWHCTPNGFNEVGGSVRKTPIQDWLKTRILISVERTNLTRQYIEDISHSLYSRKFSYIFFNCEHFVYLIKDGRERSPQLAGWVAVAAMVAVLYLSYGKRSA